MNKSYLVGVLAFLLFASSNVYAELIEYTLNDVVFSDGTTAAGSFTYDSDPGFESDLRPSEYKYFVNINITTNDGFFLGDSYTKDSNGSDRAGQYAADFGLVSDSLGNVLVFYIDGVMTDLANGGTFVLQTDSEEYARSQTKTSRKVTSGSISNVPATAADKLSELAALVVSMNLHAGISNAFDSKLSNVLGAIDDGNENYAGAGLNMMYAFCNSSEAQRDKKLTGTQVDQLLVKANEVIALLDEYATPCDVEDKNACPGWTYEQLDNIGTHHLEHSDGIHAIYFSNDTAYSYLDEDYLWEREYISYGSSESSFSRTYMAQVRYNTTEDKTYAEYTEKTTELAVDTYIVNNSVEVSAEQGEACREEIRAHNMPSNP